jgi:hypothetical protein
VTRKVENATRLRALNQLSTHWKKRMLGGVCTQWAGVRVCCIVSLLVGLSAGCAPLHFKPGDSPGLKAAKVLARIPIGILTAGQSEAWHTTTRQMESWLGSSRVDLIVAWGIPDAEYPDGKGGSVIVYQGVGSSTSAGTTTTTVYGDTKQTTYSPPVTTTWVRVRSFVLDADGVVVNYSWRGL